MSTISPEKHDFFKEESMSSLSEGWVSYYWVPKLNDAGWIENCMPRSNALKNWHLPEKKGWPLYGRVSELLLSPKEGWPGWSENCIPERKGLKGWRRECEEWLQDRRGKHKKKYKDLVWCNLIYQKIFSILGKKGSYKLLVMSRVSCSDEFFIKSLI